MTDSKSSIPANCAQEAMESGDNVERTGLAEYTTPTDLAKTLAILLPQHRLFVCDPTGGRGQLAAGVSDFSTDKALIIEIQPHTSVKTKSDAGEKSAEFVRITGDLTKVYPMLVAANFEADVWPMNPPFGIHWDKSRLSSLAQSKCMAVRQAYAATEPRLDAGLMDSFIATWSIALDRSSDRGEGFVICNQDTADRLVFDPGAPYAALKRHVWCRFVLDGNPCSGTKDHKWGDEFKTGILYWAKSHTDGPSFSRTAGIDSIDALKNMMRHVQRWTQRHGLSLTSEHQCRKDAGRLFDSVRVEWNQRQKENRSDYNLWLTEDGTIKTQLSRYDEVTMVDKRDAAALFELNGKTPMTLVTQVSTRASLQRAVTGTLWRVHPDLPAAVMQCIEEYNSVRAPLTPLNDTLRLGYLEEEKFITCKRDWVGDSGRPIYRAGQRYELDTKTVRVERTGTKPNLEGGEDTILYSGQELMTLIKGEDGKQRSFLDGRHLKKECIVTIDGGMNRLHCDADLQTLLDHFDIPAVADVAEANPEAFESYKAVLMKIQRFVNEHVFA